MLRWFIVLVLIMTASLEALSDKEILNRADALMKTQNKGDEFRAYNDYKSLYLRSIMAENDGLRKTALQGIVKSGGKIKVDVSQYAEELLNLTAQSSVKKTTSTNQDIKIQPSNQFKSIKYAEQKLILKFDKELDSKQINHFTIFDVRKNSYKYVFDMNPALLIESQNLKVEGIQEIKLAQYNPKTLRLVLRNNEKMNINFKTDLDQLVIEIASLEKKEDEPVKIETKSLKQEIAPQVYSPKRVDKNKIIMIDAGHGGEDSGAVGYNRYREKVVVLQIATQLKSILLARGYKVYMSRSRDVFIKLKSRTQNANKINADIFVSIHANSVRNMKTQQDANGIECYFLSPSRSARAERIAEIENSADMSDMNAYGKQSFLSLLNNHNRIASNKLAIDLQDGMLGTLKYKYKNVRDGGVREGPFWVLVGAQMPSVLVEVGFISNPFEAQRLVNPEYQRDLAQGLANGIERYFINNS